jgi:two-component system chemotaxis response regulator CheB
LASRDERAFDVVVIGASAGGIGALAAVLGALPARFPVAIALVVHLSPDHPSHLPQVLARHSRLPVTWAHEGEALSPGVIYAAPQDRHLLLTGHGHPGDGHISLAETPRVQFSRPSVDQLFISAAASFGSRTLAVVLSGNGHDGREGVLAVQHAGGVVIAQDEASSEYFSMPREAIQTGAVTFVLPLDGIAGAITRLVGARDAA